MADLSNRSRFCITVKSRDDLTRHFSFDNIEDVVTYRDELRKKRLKPHVKQA